MVLRLLLAFVLALVAVNVLLAGAPLVALVLIVVALFQGARVAVALLLAPFRLIGRLLT